MSQSSSGPLGFRFWYFYVESIYHTFSNLRPNSESEESQEAGNFNEVAPSIQSIENSKTRFTTNIPS